MKKLLSVVLALLMLVVMLPVTAMAETPLPNAQDGVITLENNVTLSATYTIPAGVNKIDLNGHEITADSGVSTAFMVSNNANVTICNGSIKVENEVFRVNGNAALTLNADLTVTSQTDCCVFIYGAGATLNTSARLESSSSQYATILGNGSKDNWGTTINVTGGSVKSNNWFAIYHPQVGKLNISGNAEIVGSQTGIEIRAGELMVSGNPSIEGNGTYNVAANGSGETIKGAAIAVSQHTTKQPITVTIMGGSLSGTAAISEANPQDNDVADTANVKINVTGGEFRGDITKSKDNSTIVITGGTFYRNIEEIKKYIPEGSELVNDGNDGFTVRAKSTTIIITPAGDTPKTEPEKNPTTGANDMVAAAAALMAVSALGMAVLTRKK